jgi:hypothetical protein
LQKYFSTKLKSKETLQKLITTKPSSWVVQFVFTNVTPFASFVVVFLPWTSSGGSSPTLSRRPWEQALVTPAKVQARATPSPMHEEETEPMKEQGGGR